MNVFLSDALGNVPKDEMLVPWTLVLREALGAKFREEW